MKINDELNAAIMSIPSRSEKNEQKVLWETFVQAGSLFKRLSNVDNQIIFGRRGTGKTHTLQYLIRDRKLKKDLAIYCDLSSLGSSSSVYSDTTISFAQRATSLLRDLFVSIYEELRVAISQDPERLQLHKCAPKLSELLDQINSVDVVGSAEIFSQEIKGQKIKKSDSLTLGLDGKINPSINFAKKIEAECDEQSQGSIKRTGEIKVHLKYGGLHSAMKALLNEMDIQRLWISLDEWSSIPLELQPYLADILRRCIFNIPKITVKVAALEYRSKFRIVVGEGEYIGAELGAEFTSIVNIDDYLVFDNDSAKAREFYADMFAKHIRASDLSEALTKKSDKVLMRQIFTQENAFDELVKAAEGVPRDAINIASLAAQQANDQKISIPNIKKASRQWYINAKRGAVNSTDIEHHLNWIIDSVIGERKARAFLIKSGEKSNVIESLFDARVLHKTKRDITQPDASENQVRYDAYKLDYGCYVHLMASKMPSTADDEIYNLEVPVDDYRAVRRAVLNIEDLNNVQVQGTLDF